MRASSYPGDFDEMIVETQEELDALPRATRVGYCLFWLEAEVNNGGFHQFFSNSSGLFTPQTLEALTAIRATKARALMEKAIGHAYPRGFPSDPQQHEDALEDSDEVHDALGELDSQFYEYEEPLAELVNRYLQEEESSERSN